MTIATAVNRRIRRCPQHPDQVQRINAFGLLLGGVPSLNDDASDEANQSLAEAVLRGASKDLASLNRKLCV